MVIKVNEDIIYKTKNLPAIHRAYPLVICVGPDNESFMWDLVKNSEDKNKFISYCKKEFGEINTYEVISFVKINNLIRNVAASEENKNSNNKLLTTVIECVCQILDEYGELV
jgi:hypothetical protein